MFNEYPFVDFFFFWFAFTLLQRVCDHWRRKVRDYKTPCPENHNEPDRERDCHVPLSLWRDDVCIWSDSMLKQTDLLSPWHWRRSFAEGSRFTQNWSAAFVMLLSVRTKAVATKVWKANTGTEIVAVGRCFCLYVGGWPTLNWQYRRVTQFKCEDELHYVPLILSQDCIFHKTLKGKHRQITPGLHICEFTISLNSWWHTDILSCEFVAPSHAKETLWLQLAFWQAQPHMSC